MSIRIIILLILISFSGTLYPQSDWVLKKEKDGIFIYSLKADTGHFNSIKVVTELTGSAKDLLAILLDVEGHTKWAYGTKSASVLKRVSEKEIIFYKELELPGPVTDRDIVIQLKVISKTAKVIKIESIALPNYVPKKENFVRVPLSNETWIITEVADKRIKVDYFLKIDPGGSLPPLLVNLFSTKGPYESFTNLKDLLKSKP